MDMESDAEVCSSRARAGLNQQLFLNKHGEFVNCSLLAYCPFDKSHVMKKSRLQYHIVACMKNYTGTKVPCPYNFCEYIEPEEMPVHLVNCPSRNDVQVHQYSSARNRQEAMKRPPVPSVPIQPGNRHSDENWGLE